MVETQGFQHPSSVFALRFLAHFVCGRKPLPLFHTTHYFCRVSDVHGDITTRELSASDLFPDPPRTEIWRQEGGWLLSCCCTQFYNSLTQAIVDGQICPWRPIFIRLNTAKNFCPLRHTRSWSRDSALDILTVDLINAPTVGGCSSLCSPVVDSLSLSLLICLCSLGCLPLNPNIWRLS